MPGRTRIKFCGLVRPEDVRTAVALGVDAVGFVFYPRSPRYLEPAAARDLRRLLPSWVSAVGLFVDAPPAFIQDRCREVGLDLIQFHGNETPDECRESLAGLAPLSAGRSLPYWRAVRMRSAADLLTSVSRYESAEAFVVDAWSEGFGGSGESFDWSLVPRIRDWSLILSGGLHPENVGRAIDQLAPVAVDVSTGIQGDTPRIKDRVAMEAFVAAVVAADSGAREDKT